MEKNLKMSYSGVYTIIIKDKNGNIKATEEHNIIPDEGLALFLANGILATNLYIGLYANVFSADSTTVMSTFLTSASEIITYNETSRPIWNKVMTGKSASSVLNRAVFTFNATTIVKGGFITTNSVKNSNAGALCSSVLIGTAKTVDAGDTMEVGYTLTTGSV